MNSAEYQIKEQSDFIKEFNENNDILTNLLTTLTHIDVI